MPAAARLGGITRAHLLENPNYSLSPVSSSFHGRDVFAPAAAHLADRLAIEELGRAVDPRRLMEMAWPRPDIRPGRLRSSAIYLDTFGNVKLAALTEDLQAALPGLRAGEPLVISIGEDEATRQLSAVWATTFGSVPTGAPLLTADSYGRISLAVHQGSAAATFGVRLDAVVEVSRPGPARPVAPPRPAVAPPRPAVAPPRPAGAPPRPFQPRG
ncbi:MAG: S-adenosyl-l-methionine hydroxide adenosyltransferase family protein, partial [Chloroflexota bacterium]